MNTPTLMQSEEERAPWNQEMESVNVVVSQMLSTEVTIQVPKGFDFDDKEALEDIVREQVILPFEVINEHSNDFWAIDDFSIMI